VYAEKDLFFLSRYASYACNIPAELQVVLGIGSDIRRPASRSRPPVPVVSRSREWRRTPCGAVPGVPPHPYRPAAFAVNMVSGAVSVPPSFGSFHVNTPPEGAGAVVVTSRSCSGVRPRERRTSTEVSFMSRLFKAPCPPGMVSFSAETSSEPPQSSSYSGR
jgi:hypothetical protein